MSDAEKLAKLFHDTYEELAPSHGYETREASRKPWAEVPENNKSLMIAVCQRLLDRGELEEKEQAEKDAEDLLKLRALEAAGVDNWEGYDHAMDILHGRD